MGKSLDEEFDEIAAQQTGGDLDAEFEAHAAAQEGPSALMSIMAGLADPIGTLDEDTGLKRAMFVQALKAGADPRRLLHPVDTLRDAVGDYRQGRDQMRGQLAEIDKAHPYLHSGAQAASAMAIPIPGASARTLAGAVKMGAGFGAATGAGNSEADLAKLIDGAPGEGMAELKKFLVETLGSGVLGGAGGAVGNLLPRAIAAGAGKLRGAAQKGIQNAVDAETGAQTQLVEKSIRGSVGEYRSAVQSASRDLEVLADKARGTGPVAEEARAYLASPEAAKLSDAIAKAKLETAPERISEMEAKQEALRNLTQGKQAAIEAQTGEALRDPGRKRILPRVWTLGHRMLPLVAPAVGAAIAGKEGAYIGSGVGAVMSLTQGLPGRIIKNLVTKPAVRKAFWERVLSSTGGSNPANSAIVRALESAAQKGDKAFSIAAVRLAEKYPQTQEILQRIQEERSEAEIDPDTLTQALKERATASGR